MLIDAGWPGSLGLFKHLLKVKGFKLQDIDYILATHYHPDHAGLVQDIKNADAKLIVIRHQQPFIPLLKKLVKPGNSYIAILDTGNIIVPVGESRSFLQQIGINGQVVSTPSHSQDSISLVLDTGEAFIGGLAPAFIAGEKKTRSNGLEPIVQHGCKKGLSRPCSLLYFITASLFPFPNFISPSL